MQDYIGSYVVGVIVISAVFVYLIMLISGFTKSKSNNIEDVVDVAPEKKISLVNTRSADYNFKSDSELLHVIIVDTTTHFISGMIIKGMSPVDISIPTSEMIASDKATIANMVKSLLSDVYLERIQVLYIKDIDNYIKLRIKDLYDATITEIIQAKKQTSVASVLDKQTCGTNKLNAVETQLQEVGSTVDILSTIQSMSQYSFEDINRFAMSGSPSVRAESERYLQIGGILQENGITMDEYIKSLNKRG